MSGNKKPSRLFVKRGVYEIDELELEWGQYHEELVSLFSTTPTSAVMSVLQERASGSSVSHRHICLGLLMGILLEEESRSTYWGYLAYTTRDGLELAVQSLRNFILDKCHKVLDNVMRGVLWLLHSFIKSNVSESASLYTALLRHIIPGDISAKNIEFGVVLREFFQREKSWFYEQESLPAQTLYVFLRLVQEHHKSQYIALRTEEANFCVQLFRDKTTDCCKIGRDLIRTLQIVAKVPEISRLWSDLVLCPETFGNGFCGMTQMLRTETPPSFLAMRITPLMESNLLFLMSHVRMGFQKRYQVWFAQQHLLYGESDAVYPDIIRYICRSYHPSNKVLASDIIPRWAVIGWLLQIEKTPMSMAHSRLALLFDWLFFSREENIMNIEPAMLLMYYSIPKYIGITGAILEFLVYIIEAFDPSRVHEVKTSVQGALDTILKKKVVPSLNAIVDCPGISKPLRECLRLLARGGEQDRNNQDKADVRGSSVAPVETATSLQEEKDFNPSAGRSFPHSDFPGEPKSFPMSATNSVGTVDAVERIHILDDIDDIPEKDPPRDPGDLIIPQSLIGIDETIKSLCAGGLPPHIATSHLQEIFDKFSTSSAEVDRVADMLVFVTKDELKTPVTKFSSSSCPLLHSLFEMCSSPETQSITTPLLVAMHKLDQSLSARVLVFAIIGSRVPPGGNAGQKSFEASLDDDCVALYLKLCGSLAEQGQKHTALSDIKLMEGAEGEGGVDYFIEGLMILGSPSDPLNVVGCTLFVHLIASAADPSQLSAMVCACVAGQMCIFDDGCVLSVVRKSLGWESFEQFFLWQVLKAQHMYRPFSESTIVGFVQLILSPAPSDCSEMIMNVALMLNHVAIGILDKVHEICRSHDESASMLSAMNQKEVQQRTAFKQGVHSIWRRQKQGRSALNAPLTEVKRRDFNNEMEDGEIQIE